MHYIPFSLLSAKDYKVKDYGAIADGKTLTNEAFNKALEVASNNGGGRIIVPAGEYLCYTTPLNLPGEELEKIGKLFGGFSDRFYAGYKEAFPLAYGYDDRRDLYNLYHLTNHLNLFGDAYLTAVLGTIDDYV